MVENKSPSNEGYSKGQLKRKRKREQRELERRSSHSNFTDAMGTLKNDLAKHFLRAGNISAELLVAKEKISTLEDTVNKQTKTIHTLESACEKYNKDFREQLTNLVIVETLVENFLTDLTAKEGKIHTLENTVETIKDECKEYKLLFSSSLAALGFPEASGGIEEIRKYQEPLLRCIQENRQMDLELETLRKKLESYKDQKKLSEENQELKTKLNEMERYNKNLMLKEQMIAHKLDDAQNEMLSLKMKLEKMEGCNQYLMLKEQTNTHKLEESNNELLTLKTKLHEMEENLDVLNKALAEKTDALGDMEDDNNVYVVKFGECNKELQEARKELISGLQNLLNCRTIIGIKRMGELKQQPFRDACMEKFSNAERDWKSAEQCSHWQERIKDPQWFPFNVIETNGKCEEIINENDDELNKLKNEWGEQVYEAICVALAEVNEYNPSGRYPVFELWNFKEDRKAQLKEVIQYLLKHAKKKSRRRG